MLGRRASRAAVVDVDADEAGPGIEVDAHERQAARPDGVHPRIVLGYAIEHEAVDERGLDERRVAAVDAGDQGEPEPPLLGAGGHSVDEGLGGGVGQRERERVVEHEPDRPGLAARQRPRDGIRPGVAELLGDREHPIAQLGGELIGPVVRVRHGHAGHPDRLGDRGERDSRT